MNKEKNLLKYENGFVSTLRGYTKPNLSKNIFFYCTWIESNVFMMCGCNSHETQMSTKWKYEKKD